MRGSRGKVAKKQKNNNSQFPTVTDMVLKFLWDNFVCPFNRTVGLCSSMPAFLRYSLCLSVFRAGCLLYLSCLPRLWTYRATEVQVPIQVQLTNVLVCVSPLLYPPSSQGWGGCPLPRLWWWLFIRAAACGTSIVSEIQGERETTQNTSNTSWHIKYWERSGNNNSVNNSMKTQDWLSGPDRK